MRDFLGSSCLRAGLASAQADLGEEGLSFLTARPFPGIENGRIPFEIIIGLARAFESSIRHARSGGGGRHAFRYFMGLNETLRDASTLR